MSHRSRNKRRSGRADALHEDKVFGVLMDTGCSVACSGYIEDFHGQLAYGDFGTVNTADGSAKIEGFGMLRWDVISTSGKRHTIVVPGYYCPTVEMRLFSPQDYARYHKMDETKAQYFGTGTWMMMELFNEASPSDEVFILSNIDPSTRLPFILAENGHHDVKNGKETRCHCCVTSIFDIRNHNLSQAQKD